MSLSCVHDVETNHLGDCVINDGGGPSLEPEVVLRSWRLSRSLSACDAKDLRVQKPKKDDDDDDDDGLYPKWELVRIKLTASGKKCNYVI